VLALAGYVLLAPAGFRVGPLAGLLLVSRPGTMPRVGLPLVAGAWSLLWLQEIGGLGGAGHAGGRGAAHRQAFLALTLWQPSNGVGRALAATAGAGAALVVWMRGLGHRLGPAGERGRSRPLRLPDVDREPVAQRGAPQELIDQAPR